MTCLKCGASNIDGSSFCIKCGANLKELSVDNAPLQNDQQINMVQEPQMINQPQMYNQQMVQSTMNNLNSNGVTLNYLMYIIMILVKPFKNFKDEESKLNNTKTSFILTLILTGFMTIINMLKTIYATVRVRNYIWSEGYNYVWKWDNLKNIKWIELIGKNFLIYFCAILVITIVFYMGSLIVKKQLSFVKSLSIATTSLVPAVLSVMVISPLLGKIWAPLNIVFTIFGGVYSLIILYELVNDELKLDGDIKIYFNLVCLGLLVVVGYYAYMKLFMSSVDGLNDLLNLFG